MRKPGIDGLRDIRVGIWGTGREGVEVARLALEREAHVLFFRDPLAQNLSGDGQAADRVEVAGRTIEVLSPKALLDARLDVVVHSPGVSIYRSEFASLAAKGVPVTTMTELWFEDFGGDHVVGITGSKGKTTTSTLAAVALRETGVEAVLAGNIGKPVTDFYDEPPHEVYVIEISSFQAADLEISPRIGALTLLSPDHLDWHGSYDRYAADKLNLFAHRDDVEVAVNSRCTDAVGATERLGSRRHLYGTLGRVQLRGTQILVDGEDVGPFCGPVLRGRHNLENLCGALTISRLASGSWPDFEKLALTVSSMPALTSRLESVAVSGGIEFVDDALASNPAGTVAALKAFEGVPVSLIAGGHDRGPDLAELTRALEARPDVTVVHIGDAGARLDEALRSLRAGSRSVPAAGVEEAVGLAADRLRGHGVVLFSPGAPTPVEEGTYAERSARFKQAVRLYLAGDGGSSDTPETRSQEDASC